MFAYVLRRLLYAIPILVGVNLLTFALFFIINTPDDMARLQLGAKHVTPEAIERWKVEHGYAKPLLLNTRATGSAQLTDTLFFQRLVVLFVFFFGLGVVGCVFGFVFCFCLCFCLVFLFLVFVFGLLFFF